MTRRACATAALSLSVALVAACQQAPGAVQAAGPNARLPAAPVTAFPAPTSSATDVVRPHPRLATPTAVRSRPLLRLADGSRRVLPGHLVVAFYGAAGVPGLGVLGTAGPDALWPRLVAQARRYQRVTRHRVLPAYELIAFAATRGRGNQGNYSSRIDDRTIGRYARAARRHHALLILDVQPGRGDFLHDARSLRRWLRLPYVGLGLDPEWKLYGAELPLTRIGHTSARAVNGVARWLDALTARRRLPQKLLLVHEFTDDMVRDKSAVRRWKHVAVVFNVDGFGSPAAKVGRYDAFAARAGQALGFKVFYDMDRGLMSPRAVMELRRRPVVVEYE